MKESKSLYMYPRFGNAISVRDFHIAPLNADSKLDALYVRDHMNSKTVLTKLVNENFQAKCSNCKGNHAANYGGYPKYKIAKKVVLPKILLAKKYGCLNQVWHSFVSTPA